MKKILSLGLLCCTFLLAGCAADGGNSSHTEVYGQLKGGVETSHTSH